MLLAEVFDGVAHHARGAFGGVVALQRHGNIGQHIVGDIGQDDADFVEAKQGADAGAGLGVERMGEGWAAQARAARFDLDDEVRALEIGQNGGDGGAGQPGTARDLRCANGAVPAQGANDAGNGRIDLALIEQPLEVVIDHIGQFRPPAFECWRSID
jgi:hypothetical protein